MDEDGPVTEGDLLAGLDDEQRAVATMLEGPIVVIAGAGTGKTRAVTHRIAHGVHTGVYEPSRVLAVTFTTRAAAEMRARLARLGVSGVAPRTFHSAALRQVRYLWPRLFGRPFPDVLDNPEPLIGDLASAAGIHASVRDIATEITWAKVSNIAPEAYVDHAAAEGRRVERASAVDVARIYRSYTDGLAATDRVDLDDVLLAAVGVLSTQPAAARTVRAQYRWFTVDEFQDSSALQVRLLECWLGDRDDVCVVGDPRQAIYRFAGARPDLLTGFSARFPGARTLELTRTYRCTPEVVTAATRVLGADAAGVPGGLLRPMRPSGPRVQLVQTPDQQAEATEIAARVRHLVDSGTPDRKIAVLARTRAYVDALARSLQAAGVPVTTGGTAPFFQRPEVAQAVALLAAAARHPGGRVDVGLADDPRDDRAAILSLSGLVRDVLAEAGWSPERPERAGHGARWDSWATLVDLARQSEQAALDAGAPALSLADFVEELREQDRVGVHPGASGVTVATLHATKGLQWAAVFIVGAHDGGIPNAAALSRRAGPDALREEQRLLYVGMTRALDHLCVSWSLRASPTGRERSPSRFLARLLGEPSAAVDVQVLG